MRTLVKPARRCIFLVALTALAIPPVASSQTPSTSPPAIPSRTIEGVEFGPNASLLSLTPAQQRVAYRNLQLLAPTNRVVRGRSTSPLPEATLDLSSFTYDYQNRTRSLADFINETRVAGFIVIKDGRIVAEKYTHGHSAGSVWTSFSVAKSIVSLLYGVALRDGSIRSLD